MKKLFAGAGLAVTLLSSLTFAAQATAAQDWSYGNTAAWGGSCKTGSMQSPIDISGTDPARTNPLQTHYNVAPLNLRNSGNGVVQSYPAGSQLKVGDKNYSLKGLIFHTPAEHSVMGQKFPASIQMMHQDATGKVAMIEVLIKIGAENVALQEIITKLPKTKGAVSADTTTLFNARDFMPFDKSYYRYMGSLTTPPCSEGVNWYVLKTPLTMSAAQIASLTAVAGKSGSNARPVQPRNFRLIVDTNSK